MSVGRHHLGFVVLDEPLQQNPDEHHKRLFLDFLLKTSAEISRQAIIFTFLNEGEVAGLLKAGVSVQSVEQKFLKPKKPAEPVPPKADAPPERPLDDPSALAPVAEKTRHERVPEDDVFGTPPKDRS